MLPETEPKYQEKGCLGDSGSHLYLKKTEIIKTLFLNKTMPEKDENECYMNAILTVCHRDVDSQVGPGMDSK